MTSFNIERLFTSIPLQGTLQICVQKIFSGNQPVPGFTRTSSRNTCMNTLCSSHYSSSMEHSTNKWRDLEWDSPSDLRLLTYLCVIMRKLGSDIAPLPSLLLSFRVALTILLLSLDRSHILIFLIY